MSGAENGARRKSGERERIGERDSGNVFRVERLFAAHAPLTSSGNLVQLTEFTELYSKH